MIPRIFDPRLLLWLAAKMITLCAAPAAFMSKVVLVNEPRTWSKTCAIFRDCRTDFASGMPTVIPLSDSEGGDANESRYGGKPNNGGTARVRRYPSRAQMAFSPSLEFSVCGQNAVIE
jgi:hypothetical protein